MIRRKRKYEKRGEPFSLADIYKTTDKFAREDFIPSELHSTVTAYPVQPAFSSSPSFLLLSACDTYYPRDTNRAFLVENRIILSAVASTGTRSFPTNVFRTSVKWFTGTNGTNHRWFVHARLLPYVQRYQNDTRQALKIIEIK